MSGPSRDRQLYESYSGELDWDRSKVVELRKLADKLDERGFLVDDPDVPTEQVAALLRSKADKIEAALTTIENETDSSYNELVRAIQYKLSGDYGASQVEDAWNSYSEP
jgi:hypothetical protein